MKKKRVFTSQFSVSLFFNLFFVLLLMSGLHIGIIVFMNTQGWNDIIKVVIPIVYWTLVALALTFYTAWRVRQTYEVPVQMLAEATSKVASGDFSVFMPTIHTIDKQDYLDIMIMDFNKMVEELGSIETLKTDFFSNVSHEIKTPLAVIQNTAELLRAKELSGEKRAEYLETILQATKRLSNLITNMLKLNKLERQAIHPTPKSYDVCQQLCECALQFEDRWEEKEIDFIADVEDRAIIEADEGLLELVWTNLISNAIKFTPDGGTVSLKQTSQPDKIVVSVSDNGCGMDEKTASHIFDKFYQGDTSRAAEGNGLGLALVQRILQLSEGEITVASKPGEGSVFTVTIPVSLGREDKFETRT